MQSVEPPQVSQRDICLLHSNMCTHLYVLKHTHTHSHTHTHTRTHTWTHAHTNERTHEHVHARAHTHNLQQPGGGIDEDGGVCVHRLGSHVVRDGPLTGGLPEPGQGSCERSEVMWEVRGHTVLYRSILYHTTSYHTAYIVLACFFSVPDNISYIVKTH